MAFEQFALVISLFQQLCVYLVIAWLLSKTPLFMPLTQVTLSWPHKILCYLIFSGFCVMGTYFGLRVEDSIANTRAIGAVLGGIVGGPVVGLLVGLTGGIHRYSLGGFTAPPPSPRGCSAAWYTATSSPAIGSTCCSAPGWWAR
ncbi:hypothetical protein KGEDBEEJ_01043 [Aeromonas hydrophila]|nr:hypothetical protein KBAHV27_35260 [Aeromonas hydrophila]CAD7551477.1 hypothetical protein KBAHV46_35310 [Aeromonas hydrophila]CAD7551507.1 hypothetical protein KBAHV42_35350 [Aeromonas hydrophila]CAD7552788.1 hypothetical protein KBAHV01_35230 [Aeromonas hydrophila]CAD7553213.1 hypothetical protein KBAHV22_35410 [Aeromonas hydrophila]